MGRYDEHASSVGSGAASLPAAGPHDCSAHGCPIAGSIVIEGQRLCFVHLRRVDRGDWDLVTSRIRNRMQLVELALFLRSSRELDSVVIDRVLSTMPSLAQQQLTMSRPPSRYALLIAVEQMLANQCAPMDEPTRARAALDSTRTVVRDLERIRMPALRAPGDEG